VLDAVLITAAVVAGLTGAWSPCGFSMVDTLAPSGYAGRMATTLAACATFAAGALVGGAITFGGLAALGSALGAGGAAASAVAAAVALAAAAGEARGARIMPQVRRQVPESWRRVMPVPLAAGLYGVLLGLGFTTFILTFAVWALAGVSIALGDPQLGLLLGLGFGLGRLLPVVVLAPAAGTEWGADAHAAMAERPAILRGLRAADAVALALCALTLATAPAEAAQRARTVAPNASDPSASGGLLAWSAPGGIGYFRQGETTWQAPGAHPAAGAGRLAWLRDGAVHVAGAAPAELVIPAPGADALAVGAGWVAWRAVENGRDVLHSARLPIGVPGPSVIAAAGRELGRPALDGDALLFHRTTAHGAVIARLDLATGAQATLRSQRRVLLLNPSALDGRMVYVRSTSRRQQLMTGGAVRRSVRRDRVVWSALETARPDAGCEPGRCHAVDHPHHAPPRPPRGRNDTLWTTATAPGVAYVTRLRQLTGKPVAATLLRVSLAR
jgi:hypothetical protein